jgi:hypothetical protein
VGPDVDASALIRSAALPGQQIWLMGVDLGGEIERGLPGASDGVCRRERRRWSCGAPSLGGMSDLVDAGRVD